MKDLYEQVNFEFERTLLYKSTTLSFSVNSIFLSQIHVKITTILFL